VWLCQDTTKAILAAFVTDGAALQNELSEQLSENLRQSCNGSESCHPAALALSITSADAQSGASAANVAASSSATQASKQADAWYENYRFRDGKVLAKLHLHYATLGTPHRGADGDIDNAVLMLHWTNASGGALLTPDYVHQPRSLAEGYGVLRLMIDGVPRLQSAIPDEAAADKFVASIRKQAESLDANDLLHSIKSSLDYDPEHDLAKITTRVYALNFDDDEFNPARLLILENLLKRVPQAKYAEQVGSEKSYGHLTMAFPSLWVDHVVAFPIARR
jgi:homoserine acetyltransferase